ncbi:MAG: ankyrin repeat domain-containing protein [bacterium]
MKKLVLLLGVIVSCGFTNADKSAYLLTLEKTVSSLRKELICKIFQGEIKDQSQIQAIVRKHFLGLMGNRPFLQSASKCFSTSDKFCYGAIKTSFDDESCCFCTIFRAQNLLRTQRPSTEISPETILFHCVIFGTVNVAIRLLQEGYWYETEKGSEPLLHLAIIPHEKKTEEERDSLISMILENREKIYGKNVEKLKAFLDKQWAGDTALMLATRENRINIVKKLLGAGASLNASNPKGVSALSIAFLYDFMDIASFLVGKGAEIDKEITDPDFLTKLRETVPTSETKTLDFTKGISVWQLAIHLPSKQKFIEIFLPYAKSKKTDAYPTLFDRAIHEGNTELATLLVENDFDATQIKGLPEDTDFEKAKKPIMVFLANGMPLEMVPSVYLDDDMIWPFIRRCVADPISKLTGPTDSFRKNKKTIESFKKKTPSSLPPLYKEKVLDFCEKSTSSEVETTPVVRISAPKTDEEKAFGSGNTALVLDSTPSLGQTTTARNKGRALRAKGCKQSEEPKAEVVSERASLEPEQEPTEITFDLTPGEASKALTKTRYKKVRKIMGKLCNLLARHGIGARLERKEHLFLHVSKIPDTYQKAFPKHTPWSCLGLLHGRNTPCTDHANRMIADLIPLVGFLANNGDEDAVSCLQDLMDNGNLVYDELIRLFPDLESKLHTHSPSPKSSDDDDDKEEA